MPHGGPDWSTGGQISTVHTIEDLGELAARLGSIVTHDRRGNIIWLDDFEDGLNQWHRGGDAGYEVNWNSQYSRNGGFSCQLKTPATDGTQAWITKYTAYPVLSLLGVELSFSYEQNWQYLFLDLRVQLPTEIVAAAIRYNHSTNIFERQTGPLAWAVIPDTDFTPQGIPDAFDTIKLVVDFVNKKLVRLIINSQEVDLSTLDCYIIAVGGTPVLNSTIKLETDTNAVAIAHIDDAIITQNEP